jgi:DNA polymerase III subunit epsilon
MTRWQDVDWVAFDTETSGKYPVESEICEVAAVRYSRGEVVGHFSSFVRVREPMSQTVINIHHITNEMLEGAPSMADVLPKFLSFCDGAYLLAHHAPFDMGFLALQIEGLSLSFPERPVFCTSLLARKLITGVPNHRLQTLVQHYQFSNREAHRALADAENCLNVALKCFELRDTNATPGAGSIEDLQHVQATRLEWSAFSLRKLASNRPELMALVDAVRAGLDVEVEYLGGSRPGEPRIIKPIGIVLSPGQDFLVVSDGPDRPTKRFFLSKFRASRGLK